MTDEPDLTAGHSARREYERRLAIRERQNAAKKRSIIAALKGPSAEEKRQAERDRQWAVGERGEEMLARSLARHCPHIPVLADRRLPGTRANVDFLAIAASGVYVIDAKRYHGKIEIRKPLFGKQSLWIAGRNRTKLLDRLTRQVDAVKARWQTSHPTCRYTDASASSSQRAFWQTPSSHSSARCASTATRCSIRESSGSSCGNPAH